MRGIDALIRGLSDPRAGLTILRELVFNGQAGLVEAPLANVEVAPPSFISAVFNWILFGPLLYLVAAPAYFVYSVFHSILTDVIDLGAAIKYAFTQTFHFVQSICHVFFLTAFALQAIRVFLLAITVPEDALSIQYLEGFLNLFFSLFTIFGGAPRWVRRPPGRRNPIWMIIALITVCFIANDVKHWSPAWITTVAHFVMFVTFAGPTQNSRHRDPVQLGRRDVYQKQALLTLSLLGVSFAFTQTAGWSVFYRWTAVITAVIILIVTLNANSQADGQTLYERDPDQVWQAVAGSIFVSILLTLLIGDSVWYYKWPLIILLSFVSFFLQGIFEVIKSYQPEAEANHPPEPQRQANNGNGDDDHHNDPERDQPEVFVDHLGRPIDVDERLPAGLANIGPYPTNDELVVLFWYRQRLQARLSRTELPPHQQEYVALRVYEMIPPEDIVRSSYVNELLEDYIYRALQYEMAYNPDFY